MAIIVKCHIYEREVVATILISNTTKTLNHIAHFVTFRRNTKVRSQMNRRERKEKQHEHSIKSIAINLVYIVVCLWVCRRKKLCKQHGFIYAKTGAITICCRTCFGNFNAEKCDSSLTWKTEANMYIHTNTQREREHFLCESENVNSRKGIERMRSEHKKVLDENRLTTRYILFPVFMPLQQRAIDTPNTNGLLSFSCWFQRISVYSWRSVYTLRTFTFDA